MLPLIFFAIESSVLSQTDLPAHKVKGAISMIEKIKTVIWFAARPAFWKQAAALTRRKFLPNYDSAEHSAKARAWAAERAVPFAEALVAVGITGTISQLDSNFVLEGEELARKSMVRMGGAGDIDLLYNAVKLSGAAQVIETGVAYGWSSLAILAALVGRKDAKLVSVDMPYPKMGNEEFVGIVVPKRLRGSWTLLRQPDRTGVENAIAIAGGQIDLCHFDSDKSWWGRQYAYPLLWAALRPGGIFISDDIQDNMAFADFAKAKGMPYSVTESTGKFVGIVRKLH